VLWTVDQAVEHVRKVTSEMPIAVVGVAGPGDALFNNETFEFFKRMDEEFPELIKVYEYQWIVTSREGR
jgi:nitrogen fixation protein NifB